MYFLFFVRIFVRKMTNIITVKKKINGSLPLYLSSVPFFNLLTQLATSSSFLEMSLLLLYSFSFCFPFFFDLLDALNVSSFILGFSYYVLIS
jgi:hypothetical protein